METAVKNANRTSAESAPAPRAAMWSSRPNIELLLTRGTQAGQREVGEPRLVADGRADGGADLAQHVARDGLAAPAALAGDVLVSLGGGRIQARAVAEMH